METLRIENLFARRSIRNFKDRPLDKKQISTLLKAAMAAPSAGDFKPWHFIVVTDEAKRAALAQAHQHADMLLKAPVGFVACGEPALSFPDQPGFSDYWVQDVSAATENLLLGAVGLGPGCRLVWCVSCSGAGQGIPAYSGLTPVGDSLFTRACGLPGRD